MSNLTSGPGEEKKPKKKWGFWKKAVVSLLLFVLVLVVALGGLWIWTTRPAPELVFSKETTYITEPLKADGWPDYAAYLDNKYSQGVTLENNAFIPILQAMGFERCFGNSFSSDEFDPNDIRNGLRISKDDKRFTPQGIWISKEKFTSSLLKTLPENATSDQINAIEETLDFDGPVKNWPKENRKHLAEWVKQNEKTIALFRQAAKRSRFFCPICFPYEEIGLLERLQMEEEGVPISEKVKKDDNLLMGAGCLNSSAVREMAEAACARGALRLEAGDINGAWEDFMAVKQFGRLMMQGKNFIEILVGMSICEKPNTLMLHLLTAAKLTPEQITAFRNDLKDVPKVTNWGHWTLNERLQGVDATVFAIQTIDDAQKNIPESKQKGFWWDVFQWSWGELSGSIDFNATLKRVNSYYDSLDAICRPSWGKEPSSEFDRFDESEFKKMSSRQDMPGAIFHLIAANPQEKGEFLADILLPILMGNLYVSKAFEEHRKLGNVFLNLAAAAKLYQLKTGQYPETLEKLVPDYIPAVPKDPFSKDNAPLLYKKTPEGFILYSTELLDEKKVESVDDVNWECENDYGIIVPMPKKQEE